MERPSFIFYNSFYQAGRFLEDKDRLDYYDRIMNYGILGVDKEKSPTVEALFALIKPQLNANNKRYIDGQKGGDFGSLGGRPKSKFTIKKTNNNPSGVKTITPNSNVNVNVNDNSEGFEIARNIYDKKIGKSDCLKKWLRLTDKEKEMALDNIPKYVATITDKKYQKHFLTYLNGKSWEDEVISSGPKFIDDIDEFERNNANDKLPQLRAKRGDEKFRETKAKRIPFKMLGKK